MLRAEDSNIAGRALVGTAAAVVGVAACFGAASLTDGPLMVVVRGATATSVPFGAAVAVTAAAGGGAYLLARLAGRAPRSRRVFLTLTTAGLLASAVPPLLAATTVATAVWLVVMHAIAALALVPLIASGLPSLRTVDAAAKDHPTSDMEPGNFVATDGNL